MENLKLSNLSNYFRGLKLELERKRILLDASYAMDELTEILSPMVTLQVKLAPNGEVYSALTHSMDRSQVPTTGDLLDDLSTITNNILDNESDILDMVKDTFPRKLIKHVMDYRQLNVLRYVESITFFTTYAIKLVSALTIETLDSAPGDEIGTYIDEANHEFVLDPDNIRAFIKTMVILGMPIKDFLKSIKDIEGHTFKEEEWEVVKSSNGRKLDPNNFNLIPVILNPVYLVGITINLWRQSRINKFRDELTRVQLLIVMLREREQDPKGSKTQDDLAKQIDYYANRVAKLSAKLKDLEDN